MYMHVLRTLEVNLIGYSSTTFVSPLPLSLKLHVTMDNATTSGQGELLIYVADLF